VAGEGKQPSIPTHGLAQKLIARRMRQAALHQVFVHCGRVRSDQFNRALYLFQRALAADRKRPDSAIGIQVK